MLRTLLHSVARLEFRNSEIEVVVVDNDSAGSARSGVDAVRGDSALRD
jgi:hypothetical protein